MTDLKLSCRCEKITGTVHNIKPKMASRLICYCEDCQAFSKHLQPEGTLLNSYGGTQVLVIAPAMISFDSGLENLRCIRLSNKGIYRWYSACCNTPIANTLSRKVPFVSVIANFIDDSQDLEQILGPVDGSIHVASAREGLADREKLAAQKYSIILKLFTKLFVWKLTGKGRNHPFYQQDAKAIIKPVILATRR